MEMKEVMVAMRMGGESEVGSGSSSERLEGQMWVTWPKRRPSMSAGDEEKRWMREARVGPEICIFCNGRSSMFLLV